MGQGNRVGGCAAVLFASSFQAFGLSLVLGSKGIATAGALYTYSHHHIGQGTVLIRRQGLLGKGIYFRPLLLVYGYRSPIANHSCILWIQPDALVEQGRSTRVIPELVRGYAGAIVVFCIRLKA